MEKNNFPNKMEMKVFVNIEVTQPILTKKMFQKP